MLSAPCHQVLHHNQTERSSHTPRHIKKNHDNRRHARRCVPAVAAVHCQQVCKNLSWRNARFTTNILPPEL